jgi:dephospho-CoA kinase
VAILWLFGKTGSGKSYIGSFLESKGVLHLDCDHYITQEMRDCLDEDKQMTPEMITRYVIHLSLIVNAYRRQHQGRSFVVTQAMYLNEHRQLLLDKFDDLQFVWIKAKPAIRDLRLMARYLAEKSKVSPEYARKMDDCFEVPTHPHLVFDNDYSDDDTMLDNLNDLLPGLGLSADSFTLTFVCSP